MLETWAGAGLSVSGCGPGVQTPGHRPDCRVSLGLSPSLDLHIPSAEVIRIIIKTPPITDIAFPRYQALSKCYTH